ncbi:TetR/AcrR family transcriptional regulator [Nonomuraea rhizosphaerae]|uniref:TetR/AcrR family transcriptional regulator n=1 Tax=Nonomuraea rhizosphaerae TaxID=2665663 RepID=UPI001C5FDFAF|nr:TetR/AcrR family transcriptional regulator [Nonomuraea rhizosphaerae]
MESPQERRERRRAEKRQAVRRVAVRIALDDGLEAATVEAISAAADISPRTFFNYFGSKEDALVMEPAWRPEDLMELLRRRPEDEPVFRSLQAVMKEVGVRSLPLWADMQPFMELQNRHPELAVRARAADQAKVMEMTLALVRSRPGARGGLHARLLVVGSFGAMISAVQESLETGEPVEELLDQAFALLEQGL